jgi:TonB family protein
MRYSLSAIMKSESRNRAALSVGFVMLFMSGCAHERVPTPAHERVATPAHERVATPASEPRLQPQPLGTRASPFAFYIAAMHRQIHPRFTLDFLSDIDARKEPSYADQSLWTMLAIVVNSDGTIAGLDVVRRSGVRAFDDAALASVTSAAPFPPAPRMIESADGRVHLDWEFHRDGVRGCGTPGVHPYILDSVGAVIGR